MPKYPFHRLCGQVHNVSSSICGGQACHYTSDTVEAYMKKKEIKHRVTSVAKLHANCRGEVVVHTMKKMIRDNFTIRGKLDMDKFSSPLVVHNTRHRDTNISPVLFLLLHQPATGNDDSNHNSYCGHSKPPRLQQRRYAQVEAAISN